tara:strand:+ start:113 stop:322 length:210 start_codon:yes stop_codon:yes gene_type:complete
MRGQSEGQVRLPLSDAHVGEPHAALLSAQVTAHAQARQLLGETVCGAVKLAGETRHGGVGCCFADCQQT